MRKLNALIEHSNEQVENLVDEAIQGSLSKPLVKLIVGYKNPLEHYSLFNLQYGSQAKLDALLADVFVESHERKKSSTKS